MCLDVQHYLEDVIARANREGLKNLFVRMIKRLRRIHMSSFVKIGGELNEI